MKDGENYDKEFVKTILELDIVGLLKCGDEVFARENKELYEAVGY